VISVSEGLGRSVVDPKLFVTEPDPTFQRVSDPTFQRVPDPDPTFKKLRIRFGSDPNFLLFSTGILYSYYSQNYAIDPFLIVFINISIQFQILTRIRIRYLKLRIRIRQKVPDPCGSGSTTLGLSDALQ
jgi:hypothetical protein